MIQIILSKTVNKETTISEEKGLYRGFIDSFWQMFLPTPQRGRTGFAIPS